MRPPWEELESDPIVMKYDSPVSKCHARGACVEGHCSATGLARVKRLTPACRAGYWTAAVRYAVRLRITLHLAPPHIKDAAHAHWISSDYPTPASMARRGRGGNQRNRTRRWGRTSCPTHQS